MNQATEQWESRLRMAAQSLPYPPTPEIARSVRLRLAGVTSATERRKPFTGRWRAALAAAAFLLVLLVGLLSIPSVRAAVLEFLQIGVIRIFLPAATPTPTPTRLPDVAPAGAPAGAPTGMPTTPAALATLPPPALASSPTPFDLVALDALQGETTLAAAIQRLSFPLKLPAYPEDLGPPDRVFLQDLRGDMLVLVWTAEENPDQAELILYEIAPGSWAGEKGAPVVIERTQVYGREAVWATGPYMLSLKNGELEFRRLITGHTLIWEEDQVTYRVESYLDLDEAIQIAESLAPIP